MLSMPWYPIPMDDTPEPEDKFDPEESALTWIKRAQEQYHHAHPSLERGQLAADIASAISLYNIASELESIDAYAETARLQSLYR